MLTAIAFPYLTIIYALLIIEHMIMYGFSVFIDLCCDEYCSATVRQKVCFVFI